MSHRSLADAVRDLEQSGQLVRIEREVDPHLEVAEIHRRIYQAGGPALFFPRVKGTAFPMVSNLFGTIERTRYLFRDTLGQVRKLVDLKIDPSRAKRFWKYWDLPFIAWRLWPRHRRSGPITQHRTTISQLPLLKCWPMDGGAFVTLPQVYSEHPAKPGWRHSNLGMYRVQLTGNDYQPDREIGLHYQTHRGIGVHHHAAVTKGERLKVNVIVGGPPCWAVSAVMPLPEDLPELAFAAALGGRSIRLVPAANGLSMPAEADFVLSGYIDPSRVKPEGPFGDHLGYYSLTHDFPVMTVEAVHHRPGAIWPFTVVGRPPQEDTSFGEFIHELTGPVIPTVIAGVKAVHAVDAAGVHPLLLAIGSERYVPYAKSREPMELLTQANAILGQGQLSLAKYLFITAHEDAPSLDIHDIAAFLRHLLERLDPTRDLHFQTRTTIDTLDYSAGLGLNRGSKLVIAVAGEKRRELGTTCPSLNLPDGLRDPVVALPGVLAISAAQCGTGFDAQAAAWVDELTQRNPSLGSSNPFPLILLVDDSDFTRRHLNNLLWETFTRSDPARDVHGLGASIIHKHWTCPGSIVIDARLKPHMPPPLLEDPAVSRRVDDLFASNGPLARWG